MKNGKTIPCPGYGTWKADGNEAVLGTEEALKAGYRHIDTAARYGNEEEIGKAVKDSGIPRKELFITSKCWNDHRGKDAVIAACEESLQKLGLDYVDLYLLLWPASRSQYSSWDEINQDSWQGMMELYRSGKAKAIGVSNFTPVYLNSLMKAEIPPMVDQIEFHPGWTQPQTVQFCKENGIVLEAWSPLGRGEVLKHPLINETATKYQKSPAQICLRYVYQKGVLPLVKSLHRDRLLSNLEIFDFELEKKIWNQSTIWGSLAFPARIRIRYRSETEKNSSSERRTLFFSSWYEDLPLKPLISVLKYNYILFYS